jgi:uncharacterized protein YqjF (DUF2071 family)
VQPLLPDGLTVETFHGSAWVGLVPFVLRAAPPWAPSIPWLTELPQAVVRTYAHAADGTTGIWPFSVDTARLGVVLAGRATLRLPFHWSRVRIAVVGNVATYEVRRRLPGRYGVRSGVAVEVGAPFAPGTLTAFDRMLTGRWTLFRGARAKPGLVRIQHEPWPLHRAKVLHLDDELVEAVGLPAPAGPPVVHYSPSVAMRVVLSRQLAGAGRLLGPMVSTRPALTGTGAHARSGVAGPAPSA